jgi:hypothetical protein
MAILKMLAKAGKLVSDREAHGSRRFIGRGDNASGAQALKATWEIHSKPVDVEDRWPVTGDVVEKDTTKISPEAAADYMRAVRDGDLEAADEATAAYCGAKHEAS